jgi:Na+-driven multidrug efflux pump
MEINSIEDILLTILAILVIMILVGTIYSIVSAIISFVFSNGDNDKIKKAWNGIRYAILGLIMTVLLLFIFPIIFQRLWANTTTNYSARAILERAMMLWRKILWSGNFDATSISGSDASLYGGSSDNPL